MARKATAKKLKEPIAKPVKVSLVYEGDPIYANYAEINSAQHEFQIAFAVAPTKPSAAQMEQAQTGTITLNATVQILLAPTLIPSLIKALTTAKDQHEATFGPIKEFDA